MTYNPQSVPCAHVTVTEAYVVTCTDPTPHYPSGCDLLLAYDLNGDGTIGATEYSTAVEDEVNGIITQAEREFVKNAWQAGSINNLCPGCYAGAANIVAISTTATPLSCEEPCDITVHIVWINNGNAAGMFNPGYTINGILYEQIPLTLNPGQMYTLDTTVPGMPAGNYTICAEPNP